VLAFGPLVSGAENIGVVAFRKELDFRREFKFQVSRKLIGFTIVVPLAFMAGRVGRFFKSFGITIAFAVILVPILKTGQKLMRWEGALLLTTYVGYMVWLWPKD